MTDREWLEGWSRIERAFASFAALPPEERADRAAVYREALDDVPGPAWIHGARLAIRLERTTFLPAAGKLREFAETWRQAPVAALPPPSRQTPAELEASRAEARESARRGLDVIRATLAAEGVEVEPAVRTMPKAAPESVEIRLQRLREQAEALRAEATDAA